MTDNDERTAEERYEAGAKRARGWYRSSGLAAVEVPKGARRLADVLPDRGDGE